MPKVTAHAPGTFCWIDLTTTDVLAARDFYTGLLDWRTEERPMPGGPASAYTMLYRGDDLVGGMFQMTPEMKGMGIPSSWGSYVAVEDVDAAAETVTKAGGQVHAPPFDVPGVGRMAPVSDPDGARLNLYRPTDEAGIQLLREPGAYCWSELNTHDPERAIEFYGALLGWRVDRSPGSDGYPYFEFNRGQGDNVAGMMKIRPEWGKVPAHWAIYFQVADLDASLARAAARGVTPMMPPIDVAEVGRVARLTDPTGAHFLLMQMHA